VFDECRRVVVAVMIAPTCNLTRQSRDAMSMSETLPRQRMLDALSLARRCLWL